MDDHSPWGQTTVRCWWARTAAGQSLTLRSNNCTMLMGPYCYRTITHLEVKQLYNVDGSILLMDDHSPWGQTTVRCWWVRTADEQLDRISCRSSCETGQGDDGRTELQQKQRRNVKNVMVLRRTNRRGKGLPVPMLGSKRTFLQLRCDSVKAVYLFSMHKWTINVPPSLLTDPGWDFLPAT